MEDLDSKIDGDLDVRRDTRLYGMVTGKVTVQSGRWLIVHGMIGGGLRIRAGATVHLYGAVFGDVVNGGGELRIWSTGSVQGLLERGSGTTIEPGAKVRGLVPCAIASTGELEGLRVLVAEDDDATRDEIVVLLQSCGAMPIAARSGSEGYETFCRERPDVILADLWMAQSDGYAFIKRVRSLSFEEGGLTPAIAMTASSMDPDEKTLLAGFHAHLTKPFDPTNFVHVLRSFHDAVRTNAVEEPEPRWTVTTPCAGLLVLTFSDHVRAVDMQGGASAIACELARGAATLVVDTRRISGFDLSVGCVAERTIWEHRRRLEKLIVVSTDRAVRLVGAAACLMLGVPYETTGELPPEALLADRQ
jgi:CheY-like chemotaxis protein